MNKKDYRLEKMKRYLLVSVGVWILLSIIFFGGMNSSTPLEERLGISILCGFSPIMMYWLYIYNPNGITKEQTDEEKKLELQHRAEKYRKAMTEFLKIAFNNISDDWGAELCGSYCVFALIKSRDVFSLERTISRLYEKVFSMYKDDYVLRLFKDRIEDNKIERSRREDPLAYETQVWLGCRDPDSIIREARDDLFGYWRDTPYEKQLMENMEILFRMKRDMAIIVAYYYEKRIKRIHGVPKDFTLSQVFFTIKDKDVFYSRSMGFDYSFNFVRFYLMPSDFRVGIMIERGARCLAIARFYHNELMFVYSLKEENKK